MSSQRIPNDTELRSDLKRFGFTPGPITDGTRNIYLRKLNEFKRSSLSTDNDVTAASASGTSVNTSCSFSHTLTPQSSTNNGLSLSVNATHHPTNTSTDTTELSNGPQNVVQCLLRSLNPTHVAMDTVFICSDGVLVGANRGILATQCPAMIPLLYNQEELFAVNIVMSTAQCCFHVRANEYVADLQEKIALIEGIPVARQRLIFNSVELHKSSTLVDCGIRPGVTITLELLPLVDELKHITKVMNPLLSIAHFSIKLGLDKLVQSSSSPDGCHLDWQGIPPHTMHIVHLYDIPSVGFKLMLNYLYCREILTVSTGRADNVAHLVVCCVLGSYFGLPSLLHLCLLRIRELLDRNTATMFVGFGEQIGLQPLVQLCKEHLAMYS